MSLLLLNTSQKTSDRFNYQILFLIEPTGVIDLIDNTWLYTAVTRAERQVVMIGDKSIFETKLVQLSKAAKRFWLHF